MLLQTTFSVAFVLGVLQWRQRINNILVELQHFPTFYDVYFRHVLCNFWVAEYSSSCGSEIIGTIGVSNSTIKNLEAILNPKIDWKVCEIRVSYSSSHIKIV